MKHTQTRVKLCFLLSSTILEDLAGNRSSLLRDSKGRGFINIFSKRATGFHRWAKLLDLNFFVGKTFH